MGRLEMEKEVIDGEEELVDIAWEWTWWVSLYLRHYSTYGLNCQYVVMGLKG